MCHCNIFLERPSYFHSQRLSRGIAYLFVLVHYHLNAPNAHFLFYSRNSPTQSNYFFIVVILQPVQNILPTEQQNGKCGFMHESAVPQEDVMGKRDHGREISVLVRLAFVNLWWTRSRKRRSMHLVYKIPTSALQTELGNVIKQSLRYKKGASLVTMLPTQVPTQGWFREVFWRFAFHPFFLVAMSEVVIARSQK